VSADGIGRLNAFSPQGNSLAKMTNATAESDLVVSGGLEAGKLREKVSDEVNRQRYSKEDIKTAIHKAEQMAMIFDRSLKFKYIEEANIYQVHVIDHANNDKVIRKIPPDELVHFIAAVNEMLGALFDTEV